MQKATLTRKSNIQSRCEAYIQKETHNCKANKHLEQVLRMQNAHAVHACRQNYRIYILSAVVKYIYRKQSILASGT
jgi:hypothetical protein